MVPATVAPLLGAVTATAGGVVSGGGGGGGEPPAARKAASCMTQSPESEAVAAYDPVAVTTRSSAKSESGTVMMREVNPAPAPFVVPVVISPATSRSVAVVVVIEPLLAVALVPDAPTATSNGLAVSMPLYSRIRMSGHGTFDAKSTLTTFPFAAAA